MWIEDCRWIGHEVERYILPSLRFPSQPLDRQNRSIKSEAEAQCVSPRRKWHRTCIEVLEAYVLATHEGHQIPNLKQSTYNKPMYIVVSWVHWLIRVATKRTEQSSHPRKRRRLASFLLTEISAEKATYQSQSSYT